jgi:hypothetical protein
MSKNAQSILSAMAKMMQCITNNNCHTHMRERARACARAHREREDANHGGAASLLTTASY